MMGADGGSPPRPRDAGTDGGMHPGFRSREIDPAPPLRSLIADIGPLRDPDANGLRLPDGFTSRVIARSGEAVSGTSYRWHVLPDGGATFRTEDLGWIYVSNSEMPITGGVGAVRFDASGSITGAYRILERTSINCAGGPTPWHTWLSCEEAPQGRVYECDPWGEVPALVRPALGVFKHEAVAIDPDRGHLYLTEDEPDGRFYRFVPAGTNAEGQLDLSEGRLEVASVAGDMSVTWIEVPDPLFEGGTPTRMQVAASTAFRGGEGIWYHAGTVYFSTKGDDRVWAFDAAAQTISVLYDGRAGGGGPLTGVDNLTVTCCGDVLVAEDGGDMEIQAILPSGMLKPVVQVPGHATSEVTGPAFDPSGTRLYFSSQRGPGGGWTFEVTGPFHAPA